jgi:hypothetical protein
MKNSELFQFCSLCLALDEHPDFRETIQKELSDENTLNRFIQLCSDHFILPAIYLKFKKYNLLGTLPAEYKEQISFIYEQNKIRNKNILREISNISALLDKENIRPVYLKGCAHLMSDLYSDPGERMIGDIDLLVKEKDYLKAADLLLEEGYKKQGLNFVDVTELKHFPRLFKEGNTAAVEIHRVPVDIPFSGKYSSESVFKNCTEIPGTTNCLAPSFEHQAIHNFIHDQLSNSGRINRSCSLRNMYDIYLLSFQINLAEIPAITDFKKESKDYFLLVKNTFSTKNTSFPSNTKKTNRYYKECYYSMNHPVLIKVKKRIKLLFRLVFIRYGFKFISALVSKKSRKYISRRLFDKKWYAYHFNGIRQKFR